MLVEINKVLRPLLMNNRRYALLDFPTHTNIGDMAIYAGEISVLDKIFGFPACHVSSRRVKKECLDRLSSETVLLLHGGGNFGDLWLPYQRYREAVLTHCTDAKIIQLPQSIYFKEEKERDRTARAIAAHPNFTLLVRDLPSLALAKAHFECETYLCPDMAYGLGPVAEPRTTARQKKLCLMRTDHESRDGIDRDTFADLGMLVDWPIRADLPSFPYRAIFRLTASVAQGAHAMKLRERAFRRYAQWMTWRGLHILSSAEYVVTDRLHGHILSSLLGKPHVVLDNSYGKITNFIDAWPADPYTWKAHDFATTRTALRSMDAGIESCTT